MNTAHPNQVGGPIFISLLKKFTNRMVQYFCSSISYLHDIILKQQVFQLIFLLFICRCDVFLYTNTGIRLRSMKGLREFLAKQNSPIDPSTFPQDLFRHPTLKPSRPFDSTNSNSPSMDSALNSSSVPSSLLDSVVDKTVSAVPLSRKRKAVDPPARMVGQLQLLAPRIKNSIVASSSSSKDATSPQAEVAASVPQLSNQQQVSAGMTQPSTLHQMNGPFLQFSTPSTVCSQTVYLLTQPVHSNLPILQVLPQSSMVQHLQSSSSVLHSLQLLPSVFPQSHPPSSKVQQVQAPSSIVSQLQPPSSVVRQLQAPSSIVSQLQPPSSIVQQLQAPSSIVSQLQPPSSIVQQLQAPSSIVHQLKAPSSTVNGLQAPSKVHQLQPPSVMVQQLQTSTPIAYQQQPPSTIIQQLQVPSSIVPQLQPLSSTVLLQAPPRIVQQLQPIIYHLPSSSPNVLAQGSTIQPLPLSSSSDKTIVQTTGLKLLPLSSVPASKDKGMASSAVTGVLPQFLTGQLQPYVPSSTFFLVTSTGSMVQLQAPGATAPLQQVCTSATSRMVQSKPTSSTAISRAPLSVGPQAIVPVSYMSALAASSSPATVIQDKARAIIRASDTIAPATGTNVPRTMVQNPCKVVQAPNLSVRALVTTAEPPRTMMQALITSVQASGTRVKNPGIAVRPIYKVAQVPSQAAKTLKISAKAPSNMSRGTGLLMQPSLTSDCVTEAQVKASNTVVSAPVTLVYESIKEESEEIVSAPGTTVQISGGTVVNAPDLKFQVPDSRGGARCSVIQAPKQETLLPGESVVQIPGTGDSISHKENKIPIEVGGVPCALVQASGQTDQATSNINKSPGMEDKSPDTDQLSSPVKQALGEIVQIPVSGSTSKVYHNFDPAVPDPDLITMVSDTLLRDSSTKAENPEITVTDYLPASSDNVSTGTVDISSSFPASQSTFTCQNVPEEMLSSSLCSTISATSFCQKTSGDLPAHSRSSNPISSSSQMASIDLPDTNWSLSTSATLTSSAGLPASHWPSTISASQSTSVGLLVSHQPTVFSTCQMTSASLSDCSWSSTSLTTCSASDLHPASNTTETTTGDHPSVFCWSTADLLVSTAGVSSPLLLAALLTSPVIGQHYRG